MVWLAGGPATIDLWDLKPAAPENVRGEFKPIATSAPGVEICELMPKTAKVMHHCSLVRSLHHNIPEHGLGTRYVSTGNRPGPALEHPALGSLASRLLPAPVGVPPYVSFLRTAGAGFLGTAYAAFEVEGEGGGAVTRRAPGHDAARRLLAGRTGRPRPPARRFRRPLQGPRPDGTAGQPRSIPPAGARHPPFGQDPQGVRPGTRAAAAAPRPTAAVVSARPR